MKEEIGSFFELDTSPIKDDHDNIFSYLQEYNSIFFDSGRSAIKYFLKLRNNIGTVLMPSYICESVIKCFDGYDIVFYELNEDLSINLDKLIGLINDNTTIVFMYFYNSFFKDYNFNELLNLKRKYNFTILEDTTHSIFSNRFLVGDYAVCSLRKWYPVPDGGVLYSKRSLGAFESTEAPWINDKYNAMKLKKLYLQDDYIEKAHFLKMYNDAEHMLDIQDTIYGISSISFEILKAKKCNEIIQNRIVNAKYLLDNLGRTNVKAFAINDQLKNQVPLFLPVHISDRDYVRKHLSNNGVYCPIHWPLMECLKGFNNSVYNEMHELSIPIDQRYSADDMEKIIRLLCKVR